MMSGLLLVAVGGLALGAGVMGFALISARRRLRIFEASMEAILWPRQIVDRKGRVLAENAAATILTGGKGQPLDGVLGERCAEPKYRDALERLSERALAGRPGETEVRVHPQDAGAEDGTAESGTGGDLWFQVVARPMASSGGRVYWLVNDITNRREMEQVIELERRRLLDLLERAPIGFYSVDQDGRFLFANEEFAGWLGYTQDRLVSERMTLHDVLAEPPADTPAHHAFAGDGEQGEARFRTADGGCFLALVNQDVVSEETNGQLHTRSVVRHLSREREAADALMHSQQRFRRFFDQAPIGIAQLDPEGLITEHNRAFAGLLGAPDRAVGGHSLLDFVVEADREATEKALQDALSLSEPFATPPLEVHLKGERAVICQLTLRGFTAEGEGTGVIAHLLDTTEQRALEIQFVQSQKMQAVGQLAGGVAHDFNNLLTAMIGFSDLLLLRHRPGDQSFADIMQIKQNANRAANLVRQLLAFSRQQTLQPRVLNVTDILAELSHLLRRLIGESIELKVVHGRDLGKVKADQGQLEQVIINLAVNARDAMPAGGRLEIRTSNANFGGPVRINGEPMPAGDYVRIEMEDTGCGIPEENLRRIFDPFFSTKEVGEGTGLGLSTVYGIVSQTGGFVFVDSKVDNGTRFSIYLPRHQDSRGSVAEVVEQRESRDLTGIGTILLVEDEDAVRTFSARALRNKGYNVLEARSGEAALEVLEGVGGAVDLLVTDVVMPRLDGPALVKLVRERHPALKVIFISGYAEDSFRKRIGEERAIHFLPKPFSLKQLAGKVKEVMDGEVVPEAE